MKRILMRSGKNPLDSLSAYDTLERNSIGGNSGNYLFAAAAHKLLSADGVEVESNYYKVDPRAADRINDEYDAFVVPLANAFRPDFEPELVRLTRLIEKLTIPVMMLSGGAQLGLDGTFDNLRPMEESVQAFARAILDKSSSLSVRGESTKKYLNSLGINDVTVVGCPSLTLSGPDLVIRPDRTVLGADSHIAYNIETSKDIFADTVDLNERKYANFTYIAQDRGTLEMLLWGTEQFSTDRDRRLPLHTSHPQFANGKAEFFMDAGGWIKRMQHFRLSFGPRIHGNIAALLAGTPAVVVAHDSRTLELAQYHQIPTILNAETTGALDAQEILDRADFAGFNNGHAARFEKLMGFVKENGFEHIYEPSQTAARNRYELKMRDSSFPAPVRQQPSRFGDGEHQRLRIIRTRMQQDDGRITALEKRLKLVTDKLSDHERRGALAAAPYARRQPHRGTPFHAPLRTAVDKIRRYLRAATRQ